MGAAFLRSSPAANAELAADASTRRCWLLLSRTDYTETLNRTLPAEGWAVSATAHSVGELEQLLEGGAALPDVLICGLKFPDGDGFQVLRILAQLPVRPAVYFLSAQQRGVIKAAISLARICGLPVAGSGELPGDLPETAKRLHDFQASPAASKRVVSELPELRREELLALLHEDRIIAHVQPKLRLATREIVGFEALMRGDDGNGGLITPDRLIPALIRHSLLEDATLAMTAQTVRFVADCLGQGMGISGSVNVSLPSLSNPAFCYSMIQLIEHWRVDPTWITIEITETEAMSDMATVIENAGRIRMLGFNLAIDDFGSGYSSLIQLSRIPFSELKIDGSFVDGLELDAAKEVIVQSCARLGESMYLRVVAEGVETERQLELVHRAGCAEAQGYFIARPMPTAKALEWLSGLDGLCLPG